MGRRRALLTRGGRERFGRGLERRRSSMRGVGGGSRELGDVRVRGRARPGR